MSTCTYLDALEKLVRDPLHAVTSEETFPPCIVIIERFGWSVKRRRARLATILLALSAFASHLCSHSNFSLPVDRCLTS